MENSENRFERFVKDLQAAIEKPKEGEDPSTSGTGVIEEPARNFQEVLKNLPPRGDEEIIE